MTNTSSVIRRTWKQMTELFFHLMGVSVLNSFILLTSCGSQFLDRHFRLALIRDLIKKGGKIAGSSKTLVPINQTTWYHITKKAIVSVLTTMRILSLIPSLPFIPQSIYELSNANLYLGDSHFKTWSGYLLPWLQFSWICSALLFESHNSTS